MDRLEQIALEHGLCNCDEMYTNRGLTAPDCPWHAFAVQEAMEQYATEVSMHNLERAANQAQMSYHDGHHKTNSRIKYFQSGADHLVVDMESIISIEIELI